jgi:hypothetical protein
MSKLLSVLVLTLLATGFLTNSVAMRVTGEIEGSVLFPSVALLGCAALSAVIIAKVNRYIR